MRGLETPARKMSLTRVKSIDIFNSFLLTNLTDLCHFLNLSFRTLYCLLILDRKKQRQ